MTMPIRSSYAAGHFELQIDGQQSTAYVKSVEGGWSRATVADDATGSNSQRIKQITSVDIDPITVEVGLTGAKDMLKWIGARSAARSRPRGGRS
jgi:hypothetical protein